MTPDFLEQLAATTVIFATATAIVIACADA